MEEFNTIEKAKELFRSVGDEKKKKCIIFAYYDTTKEAMQAGIVGGAFAGAGAIGGAIAGAVIGGTKQQPTYIFNELNNRRDGYLIKLTNNGIGIIPLDNDGIMWSFSSAKLKPNLSSYFFISFEQIQSIIVKDLNIFNKSIKRIKIVLINNQNLCLLSKVNLKQMPYQTENLAKFVEQYQNK